VLVTLYHGLQLGLCKTITIIIFSVVTDEPLEFEKSLFEVQDWRKITDQFRRIYGLYPKNSMKTN
jgi:hypothetical protein